jgi:hypothetical protein
LETVVQFHAALQDRSIVSAADRFRKLRWHVALNRSALTPIAQLTRQGRRHANTIQNVFAVHLVVAIISRFDSAA